MVPEGAYACTPMHTASVVAALGVGSSVGYLPHGVEAIQSKRLRHHERAVRAAENAARNGTRELRVLGQQVCPLLRLMGKLGFSVRKARWVLDQLAPHNGVSQRTVSAQVGGYALHCPSRTSSPPFLVRQS
jgi:hypothetical protein